MKKLLLQLALFTAAFANADIRSVTPQRPDAGWTKGWWYCRHTNRLEQVKKSGSQVVFLGDSITHGWEGAGRLVWEKYFAEGPRRAINLGFSGDRTEHVLWRLENGEISGYDVKVVVLMIGTNNTGHFKFEDETPIDTIIGVRAVLDKIREKQPKAKIVMCPIFPRSPNPRDEMRVRNRVVNGEIMKFADAKTIFWCDFSSQMLTADGRLPASVAPDYLHPGAYGYELWAAAVMPYIDYALQSEGKLPPPNRYAPYVDPEMFVDKKPGPEQAASMIGCRQFWWKDPEMWFHALQRQRREASELGKEVDIVLLGDSITSGWESSGRNVLAELRKTYKVHALGIGGDSVQHNLWRVRYGELSGYKAKCVMIMIGTNNCSGKPELTAAGIKVLLAEVRAKQPQAKILLVAVFPRDQKPDGKYRLVNAAVNKMIRGYADEKDVFWLDINDKLVQPDGTIAKEMMPDFLHPREAGYRIWADAAMPYFKRFCGK